MIRHAAVSVLALLALSACNRQEAQDAPAEIDQALENRDLAGNDVTAIDAAHAADAGMVADLDPDAEVANLEFQTESAPPREIDEPEERPARTSRSAAQQPANETQPAQAPSDELAPRPEPANEDPSN